MIFLTFIFGSILGSTLGAFISNRENIKNFLFGRSVCESCNYRLPFKINIPILSYILLKGRCKNCGSKIPIIVLLYELIFAFSSTFLYIKYGYSYKYLFRILESIFLFLLSFTDYKYKSVYVVDIVLLLFLEFVYNFIFIKNFKVSFLGLIILFIVYIIIYKLSNGIGEADVLLGSVSGFFARGYLDIFFIFRDTFFIGAVISIFLILFLRKNRKSTIAFCPCIVLSIFLRIIV